MTNKNSLPSGGDRRLQEGCIVCFEDISPAKGEPIMLHVLGSPTKELTRALDHVASLEGDYRLVSYSTPSTIYADITGARADRPSGAGGKVQRQQLPETLMLSRLGRRRMLHPRLVGSTDEREQRNNLVSRRARKARRSKL